MDPGSLLMLVAVMVIFYFVLVRPQKRRFREHQQLISSLKEGDEVVTLGGLYGYVQDIEDEVVWLEIADGVEVRFTKQAVSRRIVEDEAAAEAAGATLSDVVEPRPDTAATSDAAVEKVEPKEEEASS